MCAVINKVKGANYALFISTGNVYIADTCSNRIRKITVSTGIITTITGTYLTGFLEMVVKRHQLHWRARMVYH